MLACHRTAQYSKRVQVSGSVCVRYSVIWSSSDILSFRYVCKIMKFGPYCWLGALLLHFGSGCIVETWGNEERSVRMKFWGKLKQIVQTGSEWLRGSHAVLDYLDQQWRSKSEACFLKAHKAANLKHTAPNWISLLPFIVGRVLNIFSHCICICVLTIKLSYCVIHTCTFVFSGSYWSITVLNMRFILSFRHLGLCAL